MVLRARPRYGRNSVGVRASVRPCIFMHAPYLAAHWTLNCPSIANNSLPLISSCIRVCAHGRSATRYSTHFDVTLLAAQAPLVVLQPNGKPITRLHPSFVIKTSFAKSHLYVSYAALLSVSVPTHDHTAAYTHTHTNKRTRMHACLHAQERKEEETHACNLASTGECRSLTQPLTRSATPMATDALLCAHTHRARANRGRRKMESKMEIVSV
eukprot:6214566-Pleurochrysis_carterae.AAC.1